MKGKNLFRNSIAILIVVISVIVGATGILQAKPLPILMLQRKIMLI